MVYIILPAKSDKEVNGPWSSGHAEHSLRAASQLISFMLLVSSMREREGERKEEEVEGMKKEREEGEDGETTLHFPD